MKFSILYILLFTFLSILGCSPKDSPVLYSEEPVTDPTLFLEGIISTETNDEFDLTFSPDGKQLFFTRRGKQEGDIQKIYQTSLIEGAWTEPEIASFSTDRDETPSMTPDGKSIYFGSQREIPGKPNKGGFDMNVWVVNKEKNDSWSQPTPLPEPINYLQIEGENWPSSNTNFFFTRDGVTHYFTTMFRGEKAIELFKTDLKDGEFSNPEKVEGLFEADSLWKYSASVSPDGNFLVFNSYAAPGGFGGEDLYVSKRTDDGWSLAKNMGSSINTEGEESSGRFSPDGKYFFFTHAENLGDYEYGPWSIYFIETEYLGLAELFE